jgi:hypothetical protein
VSGAGFLSPLLLDCSCWRGRRPRIRLACGWVRRRTTST